MRFDFQAERHATTILLHCERKNPCPDETFSRSVQNAKYEVQNAEHAFTLHFVIFILHFAFLSGCDQVPHQVDLKSSGL